MTQADQTPATRPDELDQPDLAVLRQISQRVLWLATAIVDAANRGRPNDTGIKVGGHQSSSASMVDIMVALWFHELTALDRVSVKPHASPVLHAVNYLLGDLDPTYLPTLRARGGLQSYPSRSKDPDTVDFSTGSVGIGATAALWAAIAHRYTRSQFPDTPAAGRFVSLLGDAELDEGAIWEAVADPQVASLGELLWVVDLNRQSLDRVVPDIQIQRLQAMFEAAGWEVVTLKWGRLDLRAVRAARRRRAARPARGRCPTRSTSGCCASTPRRSPERIMGHDGVRSLRALLDEPCRPRTSPRRSATSAATTSGCSSTPSVPSTPTVRRSCSPTPSRAVGCPPRATPTTTRRCSPRRRCRPSPTRPAPRSTTLASVRRRQRARAAVRPSRPRARAVPRSPAAAKLAVPTALGPPPPQAGLDPGRAGPAARRPESATPRRPRPVS